ncbi:MAG: hypothetical protein QXH51_07365 [Candidatus Bathyarchaeia archaeon]
MSDEENLFGDIGYRVNRGPHKREMTPCKLSKAYWLSDLKN